MFLAWYVCWKDYGKTSCPITMTLGGRVKPGPKKNALHFEVDPNHGADTKISFRFSNTER